MVQILRKIAKFVVNLRGGVDVNFLRTKDKKNLTPRNRMRYALLL